MTTVISAGNSEGTRRCDARCHEAIPGTTCNCICGGRYHAIGSSNQAREACAQDVRAGVWGDGLASAALEVDRTVAVMAKQGIQARLEVG